MNETKMCASMRCFELVEDGPDGKIVLEFLERLLDFGELHVVAPQLGGIFTGHVGAQQVAALAAKHLSQFLATQAVGEPVGGQLFVGVRDIDLNEEPSSASVFLRRAELEHELVATVRLSSKLAQALPQLLQPPAAHAALFEHPAFAAHQHKELPVVGQELDIDRLAHFLPRDLEE